jgi:aminopeptidase C
MIPDIRSIERREWEHLTRVEIERCEKILGKKLNDNDVVWIGQHIGQMLRRRRGRAKGGAEVTP